MVYAADDKINRRCDGAVRGISAHPYTENKHDETAEGAWPRQVSWAEPQASHLRREAHASLCTVSHPNACVSHRNVCGCGWDEVRGQRTSGGAAAKIGSSSSIMIYTNAHNPASRGQQLFQTQLSPSSVQARDLSARQHDGGESFSHRIREESACSPCPGATS